MRHTIASLLCVLAIAGNAATIPLSGLAAATSAAPSDITLVADPAGAAAPKKITIANLKVSLSVPAIYVESITAPAAGFTVNTVNGVATFALANDLAALEAISSTGYAKRTASNTWTAGGVAWADITGTPTTLAGYGISDGLTATGNGSGLTGLTKGQVGLGNVDNTADASKPISTATQTALDAKAPINNPTFSGTVGGVTKSMVGLGNADNTSDATKNAATRTLTNATIAGASNTLTVRAASDITGTLPITNGGTGNTNAAAAINALLPSQSGHSGQVLSTNGASPAWANPSGGASYVPKWEYFSDPDNDGVGSGQFTADTTNSGTFGHIVFHKTPKGASTDATGYLINLNRQDVAFTDAAGNVESVYLYNYTDTGGQVEFDAAGDSSGLEMNGNYGLQSRTFFDPSAPPAIGDSASNTASFTDLSVSGILTVGGPAVFSADPATGNVSFANGACGFDTAGDFRAGILVITAAGEINNNGGDSVTLLDMSTNQIRTNNFSMNGGDMGANNSLYVEAGVLKFRGGGGETYTVNLTPD